MTHDERLVWLEKLSSATDGEASWQTDDPVLAGALRILEVHGWYYDPVLTPATLLELVELARGDGNIVANQGGRT